MTDYEAWALDGDRVKVRIEVRLPDQSCRTLTRVVAFPLPLEVKVSYRDCTIIVTPSWSGFGWRLLDESGAAANEYSEDAGDADYALQRAQRAVDHEFGERVTHAFQSARRRKQEKEWGFF